MHRGIASSRHNIVIAIQNSQQLHKTTQCPHYIHASMAIVLAIVQVVFVLYAVSSRKGCFTANFLALTVFLLPFSVMFPESEMHECDTNVSTRSGLPTTFALYPALDFCDSYHLL